MNQHSWMRCGSSEQKSLPSQLLMSHGWKVGSLSATWRRRSPPACGSSVRPGETSILAQLMTTWMWHSCTTLVLSLGHRGTSDSGFVPICCHCPPQLLEYPHPDPGQRRGQWELYDESGERKPESGHWPNPGGQRYHRRVPSDLRILFHLNPSLCCAELTHCLWHVLQYQRSSWSWWTSTTVQPQASLWCVFLGGSPPLWWSGSSARTSNSKNHSRGVHTKRDRRYIEWQLYIHN